MPPLKGNTAIFLHISKSFTNFVDDWSCYSGPCKAGLMQRNNTIREGCCSGTGVGRVLRAPSLLTSRSWDTSGGLGFFRIQFENFWLRYFLGSSLLSILGRLSFLVFQILLSVMYILLMYHLLLVFRYLKMLKMNCIIFNRFSNIVVVNADSWSQTQL